jgi:hypothetical protein
MDSGGVIFDDEPPLFRIQAADAIEGREAAERVRIL